MSRGHGMCLNYKGGNDYEFAENGNYAALQGEYGYYTYNRNFNAHVEIIAFDKIVVDAKQRHKAFFEQLGIGG